MPKSKKPVKNLTGFLSHKEHTARFFKLFDFLTQQRFVTGKRLCKTPNAQKILCAAAHKLFVKPDFVV